MSTADPLLLLRNSLAVSKPPQLTTTLNPDEAVANTTQSFAEASHLYFSYPSPQCLPLTAPTRFTSTTPDTVQVDLRSIYFAWVQKDVTVSDYIASAQELNGQLPDGQRIRNLVFVERIELMTWLEGASDESEYIKPVEGAPGTDTAAAKAAEIAGGAGVPVQPGTGATTTQQVGGRTVRVVDSRLQAIYNGERKTADHNSVLRGIKPTDFSHVRKHAELFLGRRGAKGAPSARPGQSASKAIAARPIPPAKPAQSNVNSKRSDPIIMLSPSASSLLRMSNIKSFLDQGVFVPPDHPALSSQMTPNILHVTRTLPSLSPKPFRFILVDSPDQFKPEYWSRVVAVFTTGQTWQFKSYKWREPQQLFENVLGVYVGEKGLPLATEIKGWGSAVRKFEVERWDERAHGVGVDMDQRANRRWRDRETVEELWRSIENNMKSKGDWNR
ncbi:accessory factor associated with RNA polymerase II [Lithohypha guttulata]|uniref:accessory factor associated with RNA polymerase II n=1 Tax=Lithohypha guttulata TaxID=1690604 RepID=UPI002DDF3423|nr:accessory factor associated with RNA polymerase II [Lithohypha guttulata]